jgi:hypothetical protein
MLQAEAGVVLSHGDKPLDYPIERGLAAAAVEKK